MNLDRQRPDRTHLLHMLVEPELFQRVQQAAAIHAASVAAWLRLAMRHITREDFPASGRAGERGSRSHESGHYRRRFMLRLNAGTAHTLETSMQTFHRSAAEIIRQLVAQAMPGAFPQSWEMAVGEQR